MRRVVPTSFPHPLLSNATDFGVSSLGAAVRSARTHSGMTLADAAMAMGVAKQTLQDVETGVGTVGLALALKIAHDMGVSVFATPTSERAAALRALTQCLDSQDQDQVVAGAEYVERPR